MDSPEKKHEKLPIDLNKSGEEVNMEIVNQYGQLMGDFSKLDDELWLAPPAHDESLGFCSEGLEWKIVSSHPHERTTEQVNNSVNDEGIVSMENNSSSNDSSQNCSSSVSPVSILKGRSVKTRKIADLLQLNPMEKNPPAKLVKKCVHCDSAKTPQWRNGPMGRKTLCNACGLQYKKGLLSDYHRPLQTIKPQTEVIKKCVHCESESTPQWRDGPLGPKTLCNACGIQYKKRLLSPDYRPIRNPRRNTSPPVEPAKNSSCDPYQKKDEEIMLSEKTEIDRNYTSDADDSSSDTDFKPTTRKKRQPVVVDKKCAHCETTTTPQWREGPLGRKTLCNACGVQYRNGRLFPEYRPLQSPSYDPSVHSHLPKKVEQMRMQKLRMMERAIFGTDI